MSWDTNPDKAGILNYKAKLKVITPFFIGGGDGNKVSRFEYIFDQASSNIYILDLDKWTSFLNENKILDIYLQFISQEASKTKGGIDNMGFVTRYQKLFKKPFIIEDVLQKVSKRIIKLSKDIKDFNTNDLACFIRNGEGKPYIPGSSIKGALRSAFLSYAYSCNSSIAQKDEEEITTLLKKNDKRGIKNNQCEKKFFGYKPNEDIFSFVRVSDSIPFDEKRLFVSKKYDHVYMQSSSKQIDKINSLPIFREYVLPGTEIEFEISIDLFKLKDIKNNNIPIPRNIEDIFEALKHKWDDLYGKQGIMNRFPDIQQYIPSEAINESKGLIMIGGGAGFHSKSVVSSISKDERAIEITKQILDMEFPPNKKRKPHDIDRPISPRAIKLVKSGQNGKYAIPGICRIETFDIKGGFNEKN